MQVLIITNRCNFKCRHCIREGATHEDLDHALLRDALPVLQTSGVRRLILTGGEPILHPQFKEILELLVAGGFEIGIVSNGWYYRRYLELLRPYRKQIAYLALSLDSHKAEEHDRVRARKGSFERVLEAIDAFQRAGYRVNISHILNRRTVNDLFAFSDLLLGKSVHLNVGAVIPAHGNEAWRLQADQRSLLGFTLALMHRRWGNRLTITTSLGLGHQYLFCDNLATMENMAIRYNGDVLFCCDCPNSNRGAVLGNLADEPLGEILPRFPQRMSRVLEARLQAILEGNHEGTNDCAFCNRVLAGGYTAESTIEVRQVES